MILLLHILVMVLTAAGAWWLSGYDSKVTGEDTRRDVTRRLIRCGITVALVELAFASLLRWWLYRDGISGFVYIAVAVPLALTWVGCLSELFARVLQRLMFPEDNREADLGATQRALDQIARLASDGKKQEAIRLCQELRDSGDASDLALETMLARLGVQSPDKGPGRSKPLNEADQLIGEARFNEAEAKLAALLKNEPSDQAAALMLMRLYAQGLGELDKANAVLESIAKEPHVPPAFIDYARRSLAEWSGAREHENSETGAERLDSVRTSSDGTTASAQPTDLSVDEMLARGYLGSAIEVLEQQLKQRPGDFDLSLKLAEAHGRYCGNIGRAAKLIEHMEANPAFSSEQVRQARAKLAEWKARQPSP